MSDTYRRLNRCGIDNCKTTLYYLEDGQWFCKNGHRREGELDIEEDDELHGQTGAKVKNPTVQEKETPVKILLGRKGFELFLKCMQLILRKQVWILVHEKGFPTELEAIVRDLWALRLQKSLGARKSSASRAAVDGGEKSLTGTDEDTGGETSRVTDTEAGYSSEYWSTDVEIDSALAGENDPKQKKFLRRNKSGFRVPGLRQTIGICYLGALLLRMPVSLGDMYKWVEAQELPFKLALSVVPEKMQRLLHPTYLQMLQPRAELNRNRLQKTVQELVILYSTQFEITFPGLNWPILALKYIRDLGLPLEAYHALKRLLHLHPLTFTFPHLPKLKRLISEQPEPKLMSLLLLSTKLSRDIDGLNRTPRDKTEPASINPDGKSWEQFLAKNKFAGDSIFDYKDVDVMDMQDGELDAYMDWYERTWLVRAGGRKSMSNTTKQLPDYLLNMFPTSRPPSQQSTFTPTSPPPPTTSTSSHHLKENIITLNSTLHLKLPITTNPTPHSLQNPPPLRPGENYPLWRPTSSIPPQANMLLEAAASVVCLSREEMVVALRQIEVMVRDCEGLKGYKRRDIGMEAGIGRGGKGR